jgi:mono/diheme cytochrome c family protein
MTPPAVSWFHLSELHGASTHLAVVAIPVYAILVGARQVRPRNAAIAAAEPWALGAAVAGMVATGISGLLVRGEAQTELRGSTNRLGTAHFWLGIAIAVIVVALVAWHVRARTRDAATHGLPVLAGAGIAVLAVVAQGYIGGRMSYDQGVGVQAAGQYGQSAEGAKRLELALANGTSQVAAGRAAFSVSGLGCASCHGMRAQGMRGPRLAGGEKLEHFRSVHAGGLFPPSIVTGRDFAAINAYLKALGPPERRGRD